VIDLKMHGVNMKLNLYRLRDYLIKYRTFLIVSEMF